MLSAFADVQLGAITMARRVSALAVDAGRQLETDSNRCKWFSIQCDDHLTRAIQPSSLFHFTWFLMIALCMRSFYLTVIQTKTSGVDIYNAVKNYFIDQMIPIEKLVSVTTDGAAAMTGRHAGFIARCKADPEFPTFLDYHCIIQNRLNVRR